VPWENQTVLGLAGGVGITDDLEMDILAVPMVLAPELAYGKPSIGALYRFVHGKLEMGGIMRLVMPVEEKVGYGTYPPGKVLNFLLFWGAPVRVHLGPVRLDTGVNFDVRFYDGQVGLIGYSEMMAFEPGIPIRLTYQIADWLHAGVLAGLSTLDFERVVFSSLGAHVGATISGRNGPILDVMGRFDLPVFLYWESVALGSESPIYTEFVSAGLNASLYLNL
jgi:hypothetical protein